MESVILTCEARGSDTIKFHADETPVFFLTSASASFSVFPSRNDVIRLRKALGEYLKASRKKAR